MFMAICNLFFAIIGIPWSLYSIFHIETKWGFNKITKCLYVIDWIKQLLIKTLFMFAIICLFIWIINASGSYLLLVLSVTTILLVSLVIILIPTVFIPCFYSFTELEEGDLKKGILKEAEKTNIDVSQIVKIDGSKRSSHANAFVSGFACFRKVAIFDTLME